MPGEPESKSDHHLPPKDHDPRPRERDLIERTIGSVVLDTLNGYSVISVAHRYRQLGGTDPAVAVALHGITGADLAGSGQLAAALKRVLRDLLSVTRESARPA